MLPAVKHTAAAGYQGPMKRELLKGAGLLHKLKWPYCQACRIIVVSVLRRTINGVRRTRNNFVWEITVNFKQYQEC